MTHQKGRPTIQKKDRRKGFTITAAPWLQDWLDRQPVSPGLKNRGFFCVHADPQNLSGSAVRLSAGQPDRPRYHRSYDRHQDIEDPDHPKALLVRRTRHFGAQARGMLKQELKKYTKPAILILNELGYLPIDKTGADLLFQVISPRYERGSLIITSNRAFKNWPEIFNKEKAFPAYRKGLSFERII